MAETCDISLKGVASRKLISMVRRFLDGDKVTVQVDSGKTYLVRMHRDRIIFRKSDGSWDQVTWGKGDMPLESRRVRTHLI